MRNLHLLDAYRRTDKDVLDHYGSIGNHLFGVFVIPSAIDRQAMLIIASVGAGWDLVSVTRKTRCLNWTEMGQVKRLFFKFEETAMQIYVPATEHVNCHSFYLHLWRPFFCDIHRPPSIFVGLP